MERLLVIDSFHMRARDPDDSARALPMHGQNCFSIHGNRKRLKVRGCASGSRSDITLSTSGYLVLWTFSLLDLPRQIQAFSMICLAARDTNLNQPLNHSHSLTTRCRMKKLAQLIHQLDNIAQTSPTHSHLVSCSNTVQVFDPSREPPT